MGEARDFVQGWREPSCRRRAAVAHGNNSGNEKQLFATMYSTPLLMSSRNRSWSAPGRDRRARAAPRPTVAEWGSFHLVWPLEGLSGG